MPFTALYRLKKVAHIRVKPRPSVNQATQDQFDYVY